jgi:hypothetical protein
MNKYTKEQLTKLWDYSIKLEEKEDKVCDWLAVLLDQSRPFINLYHPSEVVDMLDKKLWDIFSYIFFECRNMKWWWYVSYKPWKKHKLSWDVKWFIKYCKLEGLLLD